MARAAAGRVAAQAGAATRRRHRCAPRRRARTRAFFESDRVLRPPYTPYAYIETRRGTIQIELDIVNAPVTVLSFMELARAGFFNAMKVHRLIPNFVIQAGDPRGDGEGGPGYTMRDELSPLPYVRGTVGMALVRPGHGRQPVLHHGVAAAAPGRAVHGVRQGDLRVGHARSGDALGRHRPHQDLGRDGEETLGSSKFEVRSSKSEQKKGGDERPLFSFMGWAGLPLLAALLLSALGCFLGHVLSLPSPWICLARGPTAPQNRCLPARSVCARSALASLRTPRA